MDAVIKTGGKQYRVTEGQRLDVELLGAVDTTVDLTPVLLIDGETVVAAPDALAKASVTVKVVGDAKGPKVTGFTYKNKSNQRKRWGHRQNYTQVKITKISASGK